MIVRTASIFIPQPYIYLSFQSFEVFRDPHTKVRIF
jgi:hypothetical protein